VSYRLVNPKQQIVIELCCLVYSDPNVLFQWHFSDPHPVPLPDGKNPEPTDSLAILVYVEQNEIWLMTARSSVLA